MGDSSSAPLRSLPRVFVSGISDPAPDLIDLPAEEINKFCKVLRMSDGEEIAVLPGDGRLIRCQLDGKSARPIETTFPGTEPDRRITLALGMPRQDKLEESIRMGTELGIVRFLVFPAARSIVRWDEKKREQKLARLRTIAREAAEVCFRTHLPEIEFVESFEQLLNDEPDALVLSETEDVSRTLDPSDQMTLVIGPEGGWAPREVEKIGDRALTLGPRVFRVDTASAAACVLALLSPKG
jgi:16S rRNA (uracil1498-N3)-methyltransferase